MLVIDKPGIIKEGQLENRITEKWWNIFKITNRS